MNTFFARGAAIAGWFVCAAAGCAAQAPASGDAASAAVDASNTDHLAANPRRKPGGEQCPTGTLWSDKTAACVPFGPAGCEQLGIAGAQDCMPRWCFDWLDRGGAACQPTDSLDCALVGRACQSGELAAGGGCLAGTWPDPLDPAGGCVSAGIAGAAATDPAQATPPAWQDAPNGPPQALPLGQGCTAGMAASATGGCADAGTELICPQGAKPADDAPLPDCVPDPADCGPAPWGYDGDVAGAVYVLASAAAGGNGSKDKPLQTIGAAISQAQAGGTVVVGAGNYAESLKVDKPLQIRGRCSALAKLAPADPETAALVVNAKDKVQISRIAVVGGGPSIRVLQGKFTADRVWADGAKGSGVMVEGKTTICLLRDTWVGHVGAASDGSFGDGIILAPLTGLAVERVRVSHARRFGIGGYTAIVSGSDLVVDHIEPTKNGGKFGNGLVFAAKSDVKLQRVRVDHCADAGISIAETLSGNPTTAIFRSLRVQATQTSGAKTRGFGLEVIGAKVEVRGGVIAGNRAQGVVVQNNGSLLLAGAVIAGTQAAQSGNEGFGASAESGGMLTLRSVHLAGNRGAAVSVRGEKTQLLAENLLISDTVGLANDGSLGLGLAVQLGANAVVRGGILLRNHFAGAIATSGATLRLNGVRVQSTDFEQSSGSFAHAAYVMKGATLHASGCFFSENGDTTAVATDKQTLLAIAGSRLSNTLPRPNEMDHGLGISVLDGATLALTATRLVGHRTAAIQARLATVGLSHCAILATQAAKDPGDGVIADRAMVDIGFSTVAGCARTGMLLLGDTGTATVHNSAFFSNQYGIVRSSAGQFSATDSAWFNNSQQDQSQDAGLTAPDPPALGPLTL